MLRRFVPLVCVLIPLGCEGKKRAPLAESARALHDDDLSHARPIFNVHDLRASERYYRDVLGFKVDWEDGNPPDFASVTRGHGNLILCEGCQGTPGAWAMFFAPSVDDLHREFAARKALIRMPPRNMPWGLREMHVADPDGNVMRFGSSTDH